MYIIKFIITVLFPMKNSFIFAGAFAAIFLIAAMASGIVSLINAQNSALSGTTGSSGGNSTSTGNSTWTKNSTSDLESTMTGTTCSEGGSG